MSAQVAVSRKQITILGDRIPVRALGMHCSLLDVLNSCRVTSRAACQETLSVAWPGALRIAGLVCVPSRRLQIPWLPMAVEIILLMQCSASKLLSTFYTTFSHKSRGSSLEDVSHQKHGLEAG